MNFKVLGLLALAVASAAAAQAPAGATGLCKDGTYSNAAKKAGACAGHKGVQTWYAAATATPAAPTAKPAAGTPTTPPAPAAKPVAGAPTTRPPKTTPATTSPQASPYPTATPAPSPAQRATPASPAATPASTAKTAPTAKVQAPGGGPGMVWVNTATKVYHCPGTAYYGKTKAGKYESEDAAKAEGARPDANKPCAK